MYAIKALYDGRSFTLTEPVPVSEEYEVVITLYFSGKKSEPIETVLPGRKGRYHQFTVRRFTA